MTEPARIVAVPHPPFFASDRITVVSGLPRAGTSLVVQLLATAGLSIAQDGVRGADPDNPRGYFELEAVTGIRRETGFLDGCRGRVVKIVAPLLTELPRDRAYRVVFVERDLAEILASQRTMLRRLGHSAATVAEEAALERAYRGVLSRCRSWLAAAEDAPAIFVSHRALLVSAEDELERLAGFLERTGGSERLGGAGAEKASVQEDVSAALRRAMVAAVDPALYRSRAGS
jgi:hypothetical protein